MYFEIKVDGVTQKIESKEELETLIESMSAAFEENTRVRKAQTLTRGSMLDTGDDIYVPYAWRDGEVVRWQRYVQHGSKSAEEVNAMLSNGFTTLRPEEEDVS